MRILAPLDLPRLILVTILIRTARCPQCKPHLLTWGLHTIRTAEASRILEYPHILYRRNKFCAPLALVPQSGTHFF